jgi:hypothetical protein
MRFFARDKTAMPRGSKPGERRGGRQRATPNKRTVLAERILVVASGNPTATRHELLLILAKDQALPADIRRAIARKSFPAVTSRSVEGMAEKPFALIFQSIQRSTDAKLDGGADKIALTGNRAALAAKMGPKAFPALDLLLSITQDHTAPPAERRRAALEVAEYYLPKNAHGRKPRRPKFPPDEYGFAVDPDLARELRDSKLELACLPLARKLTPYAVAQRATKLQTRIRAIQQSLQCPCPSQYNLDRAFKSDNERLTSLGLRRASRAILTRAEDAEEARRTARLDSFVHGPEIAGYMRLAALREKKKAAARPNGRPLTHAEQAQFRCLEVLYPRPPRKTDPTTIAESAFYSLAIVKGEPITVPLEQPTDGETLDIDALIAASDLSGSQTPKLTA